MGGVAVVDRTGKEIPKEELTAEAIKNFLIELLEQSKRENDGLVRAHSTELKNDAEFFDAELTAPRAKTFIKNLNAAVEEIRNNKFSEALGDIEDALTSRPQAIIDSAHYEGNADTKKVIAWTERVKEPLEKAQKALAWLEATQGKRPSSGGDVGRGLQ